METGDGRKGSGEPKNSDRHGGEGAGGLENFESARANGVRTGGQVAH